MCLRVVVVHGGTAALGLPHPARSGGHLRHLADEPFVCTDAEVSRSAQKTLRVGRGRGRSPELFVVDLTPYSNFFTASPLRVRSRQEPWTRRRFLVVAMNLISTALGPTMYLTATLVNSSGGFSPIVQ